MLERPEPDAFALLMTWPCPCLLLLFPPAMSACMFACCLAPAPVAQRPTLHS